MKKIASILALLLAASCYQPKTHGAFISEHKDAWIDGYAVRINEHKAADKGLVFCRANIQEDGTAKPFCVNPEFRD